MDHKERFLEIMESRRLATSNSTYPVEIKNKCNESKEKSLNGAMPTM